MVPVKKVDRSATICFDPVGPYLAAGSVAGAIDLSFSTSSKLEIFDLDLANPNTDLKLAGGAVHAPERFSRLTWGTGTDAEKYPNGLLAGGLADGSICLWNPAQIIGRSAPSKEAQPLARLQKHRGAVRGLEFNVFSPNLLASGGGDGELCIWDMGKPSAPSLYPAMKNGVGEGAPEIASLAWNAKVQHILATAAGGGVVVWDLKKQRPVISLGDGARGRRASAVRWNPEVATQLVVASDDDGAGALQLWDLRNAASPLREFVGHGRGVMGLSWCPQDPSLLLSSGKDGRTLVWDVAAAAPYAELPPAAEWSFEVAWAPSRPLTGMFASATFEGRVSLCTLAQCAPVPGADAQYGAEGPGLARTQAPAWLRRPAGAKFGFGGRLARFGAPAAGGAGPASPASEAVIQVLQVRAGAAPGPQPPPSALEEAVASGDREALRALCARREVETAGTPDAETWAFLGTHYATDARRYLLQHLGFGDGLPAEGEEVGETPQAPEDVAPPPVADPAADLAALHLDAASKAEVDPFSIDGADNFFDNLNSPLAQSPITDGALANGNHARPASSLGPGGSRSGGAPVPPASGPAPATEQTGLDLALHDAAPGEGEDAIQRALVLGDCGGAADAAAGAGRLADAMLVASLVGGDAFVAARLAYMAAHPRPFMRLVAAQLRGDWAGLVTGRPAGAWRETLALLLSAVPPAEFEALAGALAARLAAAGDAHAASLCRICAGDVDAAVGGWAADLGRAPAPGALEALVEKALVLGLGAGAGADGAPSRASAPALAALLAQYADALVADGRLAAAAAFLDMVPPDAAPGVADLRDRIAHSAPAPAAPAYPPAATDDYGGYSAAPSPAAPYGYSAAPGGYAPAAPPPEPQRQEQAAYGGAMYNPPPPAAPTPAVFQPPTPGYAAPGPPAYGAPPPPAPTTFQPGGYAAPAPPTVFQPPSGLASPTSAYGASGAATFAPPLAYAPPQPAYTPPAPQPYAPPPATTYAPNPAPPSQTYAPPQPQAYAPPQPQAQTYAPSFAAPPQAAPPAPPAAYAPPAQQMQPAPAPHAFVPPPAPAAAPVPSYNSSTAAATYAPPSAPHPSAPSSLAASSTPTSPARGAGPPPGTTLLTADTSGAPASLRPVLTALATLFKTCEAAFAGQASRARELDDASRRLGLLAWRVGQGAVSDSVAAKLAALGAALDAGDLAGAGRAQAALTRDDWDEASAWLSALKRLLKLRQLLG